MHIDGCTMSQDDDALFDPDSDGELNPDDEDEERPELTNDQLKLLYMVSRYSHAATGPEEKEEWIRKVPLMVLVYEGIVAQVYDYDYAPSSEMIHTRRIYFNTSQEGRNDLDVLRELDLCNALKLSSKEHQSVTAYQISFKGQKLLEFLSIEDRQDVDSFIFAPSMESARGDMGEAPRDTDDLLKVTWDGTSFWLRSNSGYERESTVTDTEDVSYVSSPYLPNCLRHGGREAVSNADKAHLSAAGETNIRDELSEVLVLNNVNILIGEFIPFGANHILSLNMKLGSTERVQGGFFTALVDDDSAGTKFEVPPGLTKVSILDYSLTEYINVEADIFFPEDQGIVQIENFGIHLHADGTICYGMKVEAVMDRIKDAISLDHLARLLVDVHQDSSRITDSIVSAYQLGLLDLVFVGDRGNRDKINIITCDDVVPKLPAEKYMDRGENENELKQVLGETRFAYDISEEDVIIFGNHGILLGGTNSRMHEPTLLSYLSLTGKDIFIQNFFARCFITLDSLRSIRRLILDSAKDPNALETVRGLLAQESRDIIMLNETCSYVSESLDNMKIPAVPQDPAGKKLFECLDISRVRHELQRRITDLAKNTASASHEIEILRQMSLGMKEDRMFRLQETLNTNTKAVTDVVQANQEAAISLTMMQIVLVGSLAFQILDRLTGEWTVVNRDWANAFIEPMLAQPFAWFIVNIVAWLLLGFFVLRMVAKKSQHKSQVVDIQIRLNEELNIDLLDIYIDTKDVVQEDVVYTPTGQTTKTTFKEGALSKSSWGGTCPKVTLEYDDEHGFMLSVYVHYSKAEGSLKPKEIRERILSELTEQRVLKHDRDADDEEEDEE